MLTDRLITVAIHTFERAHQLKEILEADGIGVTLGNVNLTNPSISAGVRVRIKESDLPQALRIIENIEILNPHLSPHSPGRHGGTILVPTDFSEKSLNAAMTAFRMAAALKVGVHLLHAFIDPTYPSVSVMPLSPSATFDAPDELIAESKERHDLSEIALKGMREFEEKLREKIRSGVVPGVRFTSEITEGLPEDAIDKFSATHNNILTVMGSKGHQSASRDIMGSITAEVLDNSATSVLSIPAGAKRMSRDLPSNVLFFATATQDDIITLDTLYHLFPETALHITIALSSTKIARRHDREMQGLLRYCRGAYPAYSFRLDTLSESDPLADIDRHSSAGAQTPDMILVSNRRRNIFSRLFNPTLAHRLLFHTDIPLLSITTGK